MLSAWSCFRGICSIALLVGALPVLRKWPDPALATLTWLFQAAEVSHRQCPHHFKAAGRKIMLVPATTMKLWMVSKHLEHPWRYQEKAVNWYVLPKEFQSSSRTWVRWEIQQMYCQFKFSKAGRRSRGSGNGSGWGEFCQWEKVHWQVTEGKNVHDQKPQHLVPNTLNPHCNTVEKHSL